MELRSLACFLVLAETLNFRRAAERLNITQPALSVRLKRLEDELGLQLLRRSRSRVSLSPEGRRFLPKARRLLQEAEALRAAARGIAEGEAGELRIGYTPVSFFGAPPRVIRRFRAAHPRVRVSLFELLSGQIETALETGDLDLGFLHTPFDVQGLAHLQLKPEDFVVALPEEHPLAKRRVLRLSDLAGQDFVMVRRDIGPVIHDRIVDLCRAAGFTPRVVQEASSSIAVVGLVSAGLGIGLVISAMSSYRRDGIRYRPISGPKPVLPFALAWRAAEADPLIESFCRTIDKRLLAAERR